MKIALLADHTDLLATLADWYANEWEPYYGANGPGDALADLTSRCNRDTIPIGLIALDGDQALGVVALDLDVATNLTPSVVGLLVTGKYRGRGVAAKLLDSATHLAKSIGYSRLYISTTVLGGHLARKGWHTLRAARFINDEKGFVYVRNLAEATQ